MKIYIDVEKTTGQVSLDFCAENLDDQRIMSCLAFGPPLVFCSAGSRGGLTESVGFVQVPSSMTNPTVFWPYSSQMQTVALVPVVPKELSKRNKGRQVSVKIK